MGISRILADCGLCMLLLLLRLLHSKSLLSHFQMYYFVCVCFFVSVSCGLAWFTNVTSFHLLFSFSISKSLKWLIFGSRYLNGRKHRTAVGQSLQQSNNRITCDNNKWNNKIMTNNNYYDYFIATIKSPDKFSK